jgi:hypothetical protein
MAKHERDATEFHPLSRCLGRTAGVSADAASRLLHDGGDHVVTGAAGECNRRKGAIPPGVPNNECVGKPSY